VAGTDLYRFFDAKGGLLYVGISLSALTRWQNHRGDKTWWADVAETKVEHFPDRGSALIAESRAIAAENPRFNVLGNPGAPGARGSHRRMLTLRLDNDDYEALRVTAAEAGVSMEAFVRALIAGKPQGKPTRAEIAEVFQVEEKWLRDPAPGTLIAKRIRDEKGKRL